MRGMWFCCAAVAVLNSTVGHEAAAVLNPMLFHCTGNEVCALTELGASQECLDTALQQQKKTTETQRQRQHAHQATTDVRIHSWR